MPFLRANGENIHSDAEGFHRHSEMFRPDSKMNGPMCPEKVRVFRAGIKTLSKVSV
jgi:hypothetical protein